MFYQVGTVCSYINVFFSAFILAWGLFKFNRWLERKETVATPRAVAPVIAVVNLCGGDDRGLVSEESPKPAADGSGKDAPAAHNADDAADNGKDGKKRLHARHYSISPDEADNLKRELMHFGNQHSYNFMTRVLKLIENARG